MGLRDLLRSGDQAAGAANFAQQPPVVLRSMELSFSHGLEAPDALIEQMLGEGIAPRIRRNEALQVAAVIRARNLICGTLSTLDIIAIDVLRKRREWPAFQMSNGLDPGVGGPAMLAHTYEDLLFESVAFWRVLERDSANFPRFFRRIPPRSVSLQAVDWLRAENTISDDYPFAIDSNIYVDGLFVPRRDVIRFDSPNLPMLIHGAGAIRTLLKLDQTVRRNADNPMPLGAFTPADGADPPGKEEVEEALTSWEIARRKRVWGYISAALELQKLQWSPEELQLVSSRESAILDIARLAGLDPEDLSVSVTSRTYQNSEQRRQDLIDFSLSPFGKAITDRLSRDDVTPHGTKARVDYSDFLRADTKTRMQGYQIGKAVGAITEDEIREAEDKPLIPASQKPQVPPQLDESDDDESDDDDAGDDDE